jgi:cation diffusion facilitator CzcD-associated flavoprotein CzcO
METWRERMPEGMLLKSDGFASNLSSPKPEYSLKAFCEMRDIPYDDTKVPVQLETFVEYGLWFQQQLVPEIDERRVVRVAEGSDGFVLETVDGEQCEAKRVVLAVGISEFAWIPKQLRPIPGNLLTHSSQHRNMSELVGKEVAVIGGGASAIDLAAALHGQDAKVCIIARRSEINFHNPPPPGQRTLKEKLRNPSSGLGPGWKSRAFTEVPNLFRRLPAKLRVKLVREHLGPAPGWPMRERVMGKVPMLLGTRNLTANVLDGKVQLLFLDLSCRRTEYLADHVIAATGYRADVRRLKFLSQSIQEQLRTISGAPELSSRFESSVPGLYFVGLASANSFGPMMRFAFGADYTSRLLARHLQRKVRARGTSVVAYPKEALN